MAQFPCSTLLRRPQVEALTGLKRATIYQRMTDGLLPRPVKVGVRVSGWPAREITAVNEALIRGASDDQIRTLVSDLVAQRARQEPGPTANLVSTHRCGLKGLLGLALTETATTDMGRASR